VIIEPHHQLDSHAMMQTSHLPSLATVQLGASGQNPTLVNGHATTT